MRSMIGSVSATAQNATAAEPSSSVCKGHCSDEQPTNGAQQARSSYHAAAIQAVAIRRPARGRHLRCLDGAVVELAGCPAPMSLLAMLSTRRLLR
jgi:hypothetical protein